MILDLPSILALIVDALSVIIGASVFTSSSKAIKIIVIFLTIGIFITTISIYLAYIGVNNMYLFHFHTLIENISLLTVISIWTYKRKVKKLIYSIMIGFSLFWLISKFSFENIYSFDNYTSSLNNTILILASGYLISRLLLSGNLTKKHVPALWILTGVLIYYSGSLVLFALSNLVYYWQIHNCLEIVYKLLIITGFIFECKK